MKKLETIQSRKIMSAYGGMGSIIETKDNGSLLIEDYTEWECYQGNALKTARRFPIQDGRLLKYLQDNFSSAITDILQIPDVGENTRVYNPRNQDLRLTLKSRYFPEWFFCPKCRQLHKLGTWEE